MNAESSRFLEGALTATEENRKAITPETAPAELQDFIREIGKKLFRGGRYQTIITTEAQKRIAADTHELILLGVDIPTIKNVEPLIVEPLVSALTRVDTANVFLARSNTPENLSIYLAAREKLWLALHAACNPQLSESSVLD